MSEKIKDKIFNALIWSFLILYLLVASISFWHCIEFCMVGNPLVLSVMMSFAFEVGLALTLFSVLITDENKNNIVSWILMTLLTCVQVMGNIFSVEKFMELSNNNFYIYIQHGFLHWFTDDMPQSDIMSIIAIILGALLPVVALLMTSMVARNWKNRMNEKKSDEEKVFGSEQVFASTEHLKETEQKPDENQVFSSDNKAEADDNQKVNEENVQKNQVFSETEQPKQPEQASKLTEFISKAKELANQENKNNIINDGSLLTPEESAEAKRATAQTTRTPISLFRPN